MRPLVCPDGSQRLCKGPDASACLIDCATKIKCAQVPEGAWCFPGLGDCTDNSKTHCKSFDQGGLIEVPCPDGKVRLCQGPDVESCAAVCGDSDPLRSVWQPLNGRDPFWGVPTTPPSTAATIVKDLCGPRNLNGNARASANCECIARHGTSACAEPIGDSAVWGALAAARIFDLQL